MQAPHRSILLPTLVVGLAVLALGGCGGGGYGAEVVVEVAEPVYTDPCCAYGSLDVDNFSAEYVETFYLAPAATDLWTDELLGWPLAPGEVASVGEFLEDWYDAEADLEFGDYVQWLDVFVPGAEVTVFEVY